MFYQYRFVITQQFISETLKPAIMTKYLISIALLLLLTKDAVSQITLERNYNTHEKSKKPYSKEQVYFEYRPSYKEFLQTQMLINLKFDSSEINRYAIKIRKSDSIATYSRDSASRSNARLNFRIDSLNKVLQETKMHIINEIFSNLKAQLLSVKDSLNDIELNATKLSYISWDIFNKLDSTKQVKNKDRFFDSLTTFRVNIDRLLDRKISRTYDSLFRVEEETVAIEESVVNLSDSTRIKRLINQLARLRNDHKAYKSDIEKLSKEWNGLIERNIAEVQKDKKIEASALPYFNSIPGLRDYNGTLSIIGNNSADTKGGVYIEFGGFTGILGSSDNVNRYNLFIPEVSTYGFFLKSNYSLKAISDSFTRIGLNISFYYLGKKIKPDTIETTKAMTTSLFQLKFGIEYILVKDLFSAYANINGQSFMTNRDSLKTIFNLSKGLLGNVDFGFRMLLNPSKKVEDWKIYFDLNFIVNGGDIKKIGQSNDFVIPNFRIGLRKSLGRQ
jgi:hypothetical protein